MYRGIVGKVVIKMFKRKEYVASKKYVISNKYVTENIIGTSKKNHIEVQ